MTVDTHRSAVAMTVPPRDRAIVPPSSGRAGRG